MIKVKESELEERKSEIETLEKKIADRGPEHRALAILYKEKPQEEEARGLRPDRGQRP